MTSKISCHTGSYIPYRTVLPEGYLCPDPEPVLDGMQQRPIVTECDHLLRHYFGTGDRETGNRADVLVASDGFIFYDESSLNIRVNPDLYIAFGVDAGSVFSRDGYVIWEAGKPPDFALEVASESTHRQDTERKPGLYARIGIGEYRRFDGNGGEFYGYVLAGDRLVDGAYQPIPITTGPDGMVWGYSEAFGLYLCGEYRRLRFFDPKTDSYLRSIGEEQAAHRQTQDSLSQEQAARREAEAEIERLRAENDRLRG